MCSDNIVNEMIYSLPGLSSHDYKHLINYGIVWLHIITSHLRVLLKK